MGKNKIEIANIYAILNLMEMEIKFFGNSDLVKLSIF